MNAVRLGAALAASLVVTAGAMLAVQATVRGADHGDSPQVRDDTRADINDVYVFASPATPANTVLIMTVCPLAGVTGPKLFSPGVKYEFAVDTTGDAVEDQIWRLVFAKPDAAGHQSYVLTGPNKIRVRGVTEALTVDVGDAGQVFAGIRDDPFFFDLIGFKRGLAFSANTSRNFFDGLNTMAIVLEVPTTSFGTLGESGLGVWARTRKGKTQIDRMGRPAINTVLVAGGTPKGNKDLFNRGSPKDDVVNWRDHVIANLKAAPLSRNDADAQQLADLLLPDVLTYNPGDSAGFLNGRKLTDDVIDIELGVLSNGAVTTDFVNDDNLFLPAFPYLAAANP
jgi:hypothetical protein